MAKRPSYDWVAVQAYYDRRHSPIECRLKFGFTHNAWRNAVTRGLLSVRPEDDLSVDKRFRYDWDDIRAYYDAGHSLYECAEKFGFCTAAWTKAVRRGVITARPIKPPLTSVLEYGNRASVKRRLLADGILKQECSRCGISEWRGKPLSIQIDHINGINNDYRLENLRMLCPNCHSLTETYGHRNVKRKRSEVSGR